MLVAVAVAIKAKVTCTGERLCGRTIDYPTYLWHKDKAERGGSAEDDEDGHHDEGRVLLVAEHEGDGGSHDAHEYHVVDTHTHVLGVVQSRDANVSRLPR